MIRKTRAEDIPAIMQIIRDAQAGMKLLGISQWQNGYPNESSFAKDIAEGVSHVYEECGIIYLSNEGSVENKRVAYEKVLN